MSEVSAKQVNEVLKKARDNLKDKDSPHLKQKVKDLLMLRNKLKTSRNDYLTIKSDIHRLEDEAKDFLYNFIAKVETEVLRSGKNIRLSSSIPRHIDKIIIFIGETLNAMKQSRAPTIWKHIEKLTQFSKELSLKYEGYKNNLLKAQRKYSEVKKEVEKAIAAIKQILEPEKYVIVNVRDKFE